MKTVSVALVMCLHIGVDPPDVAKISPCSKLECWIGKNLRKILLNIIKRGFLDPFSMTPRRALESIAVELQRQYERWQSKARYKSSLDPTQEDIKKLCLTLRRNARVCIYLQSGYRMIQSTYYLSSRLQNIRLLKTKVVTMIIV
jgi:regulator-associated protein of mTOR